MKIATEKQHIVVSQSERRRLIEQGVDPSMIVVQTIESHNNDPMNFDLKNPYCPTDPAEREGCDSCQ